MADQDQELEQIARDTEDDLMQGAFEPKAKEAPEAEPEQKVERARDPETGRFARAEPTPPTTEQTAPESGRQEKPATPEDEILPSWRAREINEERRAAVAELERLRIEHARAQAWIAQQQRAAQPAQPDKPPPDPLLDPVAYDKYRDEREQTRLAQLQQQMAIDRLNWDLKLAHVQYGKRFEQAYEALVVEGQRGNSDLVHHLTRQRDPGTAIMRWFSQVEMEREIGPDFSAYKQKTREELLNDPEFLAQAEQRLRDRAMGNSGQPSKPNTVVRMPPSLAKATGSADAPATVTDGSEEQLFAYAMQPKRRG